MKVLLVIMFVSVISAVAWACDDPCPDPTPSVGEQLYLVDSISLNDDGSDLFRVHLDSLTGRANLEFVANLPFDRVDALACTPDGNKCYAFDRYSSEPGFPGAAKLGWLDLHDNSWHDVGYVTDSAGYVEAWFWLQFLPQGNFLWPAIKQTTCTLWTLQRVQLQIWDI